VKLDIEADNLPSIVHRSAAFQSAGQIAWPGEMSPGDPARCERLKQFRTAFPRVDARLIDMMTRGSDYVSAVSVFTRANTLRWKLANYHRAGRGEKPVRLCDWSE
jgi:hypothetical protein